MKFCEAPAGSLVRQVGVFHRPVFVKIAQAFEGSLFMRYPDGKEFPVNAISLSGELGEFDPDMEVEILDVLDLVMSPSEVDLEFDLSPGTCRQTIAHKEWPQGSYRSASKGALLISAEAAERRYGYRLQGEALHASPQQAVGADTRIRAVSQAEAAAGGSTAGCWADSERPERNLK